MYEKINWETFMQFEDDGEEESPKISIPFSLDTPYLKKDFKLDLIIWNLTAENLKITKKAVDYVLRNFNILFETAWTSLYHQLCIADPYSDVAEHTLSEFYVEQIELGSSYYDIQLEINAEHLLEDAARYCFVVATTCDYRKWMISDDGMRVYMVGNKYCRIDTNNDNLQMLEYTAEDLFGEQSAEVEDIHKMVAEKMDSEKFQYAPTFVG